MVRRNQNVVRAGFTLVELLVVMGVILVLMTLAVAFVPRVNEQQRVSRAATQLQGWLAMSKQWALRDQAPRGVRLTFDPTTNRVTTLYYIEQPDDWVPGGNTYVNVTATTWRTQAGAPMSGSQVQLFGVPAANAVDFSGNAGGVYTLPSSWPVQGGDYLEVGSGSKAQLGQIVYDPSAKNTGGTPSPILPKPTSLIINTSLTATYSNNFRVIRSPRVRPGELPLQLPADTAIDIYPNSLSGSYNSPLPPANNALAPNSYDIMFTPFGGVVTNGVPGLDLRLWVIDTALNPTPYAGANTPSQPTYDGQQLIVTINVRSGFISVHPAADPSNPYSYTQDGRTSGF